ncbi:MAG: CTP synthase [Brumimicrobium sp.]
MTKYVFITGGVSSSLGKGIIASSLAKLFQARGLKVTIQKFDPYINIDPGTLNPYEHGECFVTDDGAETDLDLGHYERFLNRSMSEVNSVTSGKVYEFVIEKEREGGYKGKTVQVIPHITDEIIRRFKILENSADYDIILTEIGGTVGDIESLPFIESIRQMKFELGDKNCLVVHLTLVPYLKAADELKTKPTQHSVKQLNELGVRPDIIVCRTETAIGEEIKRKIALFCNVEKQAVIEAKDVNTIYAVPIDILREGLDSICLRKMEIKSKKSPDLKKWAEFLDRFYNPTSKIKIGLIGKYAELQDAYKSILEAMIHAGSANACRVEVESIQSDDITKENVKEKLNGLDGIIVAPGFGNRGIEGKIYSIQYAREQFIPFFGICLGMQCCVIEFARNVVGLKNANSTEMDPNCPHPVIHLMEEQKSIKSIGGTMRLGSYNCQITKNSKVYNAYKNEMIQERHRHRYEFNNYYQFQFERLGLRVVGKNKEKGLVEIVELDNHPFFVGTQFHPEYKSTVENPHPLFVEFVRTIKEKTNKIHKN